MVDNHHGKTQPLSARTRGKLMDIIAELERLPMTLDEGLGQAVSLQELEDLEIHYLGRKGLLAALMSRLPELAPEQRPLLGKSANIAKEQMTIAVATCRVRLEKAAQAESLRRFDPTIPGRIPSQGSLHPITIVMEEICNVLKNLGFEVISGPEVETDFHNFGALNFGEDHPARDMQDTFFVTSGVVMRTHTSPMQVRAMLERKNPPLAVIAPGKVYRRDSDLTHTPMFHQIEGLLIDKKITLAHLRGILSAFVRELFGPLTKVRFRPSFFPFTEPSVEVDISCILCNGTGHSSQEICRICKGTGWLEVLGSGMVDPAVFAAVGFDSATSGFAFGLGVERVTMLKYGITDLRMFFENDLRFLGQFV